MFVLFLGLQYSAYGQSCPPNIDFELGNTSYWSFYTGSCCPITTPTSATHTAISGPYTDGYGFFPMIAPGGSYSVRLNAGSAVNAEKARYYVHVPSGAGSYALVYKYAVVLQDPGHPDSMQPRFIVNTYDSATGAVLPAGQLSYVSSPTLPGFSVSTVASDVVFKSWALTTVNLSGLGGTTVVVDFAASGCGPGGHFGYAYIDMSCGLFATSTVSCDTASAIISAPPGLYHYAWYDSSTFATVLDTSQTVTFSLPSSPITYAVVLVPYSSGYASTTDTLYTHIIPSHLRVHRSSDTTACFGVPVTISAGATDIATPLTYSWSPSSTLSCATCATPVATPSVVTAYYFTATNANGCSITDSITVTPSGGPYVITGASTVCVGASITHTDTAAGGTWGITNPSLATIDASGHVTGIAAGVDTVYYSVSGACGTFSTYHIISVAPLPYAGTISGADSVCQGATITLTTTGFGGTWRAASSAIAIAAAGVVTGVAAGVTTINYVVTNSCGTAISSHTVVVKPAPFAGIITTTSSTLCVGSSATVASTVADGYWWATNAAASLTGTTATGSHPGIDSIYYIKGNSCGLDTEYIVLTVTALDAPCAPNMDFELGNTAYWSFYNGTCCPLTTTTTVVPHGVTNASWGTTYGGIPRLAPGGAYSVQLANLDTARAQKARYYVHVPAGATHYGLIYQYAVVLEDAGHPYAQQPRFEMRTVDSATGTALSTGNFSYIASAALASLPGFYSVTVGASTVYCKNWSSAAINLSGMAGRTVIVDFAASACGYGGHAGYAFIDMSCGAFAISTASCDTSTITLCAPPGYHHYSWYDSSTFATVLDTNQAPTFSLPASPTTFAAILTPDSGYGVADTLYTHILPSHLRIHRSNDTTICFGTPVTLSTGATDIATPLTYSWSPSSTLSCGTCSTTVAIPTVATTYYFSVVNANGCSASDAVTITPIHGPGTITGPASLCISTTTTYTDTTTGGTWHSTNPSVATISSTGIVTAIAPGTDTIVYALTAACGAVSTFVVINVVAAPTAGVITGSASACAGSAITLTASVSGGVWSSAASSVATVAATGVVTALSAGTAIISYTVTNICGTATATDAITIATTPSAGSLSGPGSVCVGAVVTLSSTVAGGYWVALNASATIAGGGLTTGVTAGSDTMYYIVTNACGTASAPFVIAINPLPVAGTITGTDSVCTGTAIVLIASIAGGAWGNMHPAISTVSGGVVTGISAGADTIFYIVSNSCGSDTAFFPIRILSAPSPGTISGSSSVCVGDSIILSASVTGGTWASSNTNASVAGGVVTGLSAGSSLISYTTTNLCGSLSATYPITINPLPYAGTITGADSICEGDTATMSNTVTGGAWSSSNTSLAVISTSGLVNGISTGTLAISYTTTNSCGTAYATHALLVRPASVCPTEVNGVAQPVAGISIFPNPNNGSFVVAIPAHENMVTVSLVNVHGQVLLTKAITDKSILQIPVDVSQVAAGVYMVKVDVGNITYRSKVVIW